MVETIHLGGMTRNPDACVMAQAARNLTDGVERFIRSIKEECVRFSARSSRHDS